MPKKRRQFYIANVDLWRWERLTDTFLKLQLERMQSSYAETENAISVLNEASDKLTQLAFEEYRKGTPRLRETVETAYAEIRGERKRILYVQDRLAQVMDQIKAEVRRRKTNSDRKLPA